VERADEKNIPHTNTLFVNRMGPMIGMSIRIDRQADSRSAR
jgi:hypothetical protein